jgi:hypothetical protein
MGIADRKQIALEQKIAGLASEFTCWLDITESNQEFEKHHTQVRALTGHLSGLWYETRAIFEQAKNDGTVLSDARNIESLVLGLRRIWEFFRGKLVQRRDPLMRQFLQVADELAWACYKPILDRCTDRQHHQPPLVFLNGGLSPYALSRDQAFLAEDVPGEALTGRTYDPILQHLPISVIGVPWYQVAHLPDLPVVAHETGHAVEQDFKLHDLVLDNLKQVLGEYSPRLLHWQAWSKEVFADLWGCLTLGPAYGSSLVDFLAGEGSLIENEIATVEGKYPTAYLRILLCVKALNLLEFKEEGAKLQLEWKGQYPQHAMTDFEEDICAVAMSILSTPLMRPGLTKALLDIKELRFSAKDWQWARIGADEQDQDRVPNTANTIVRWSAAARYLYDQSPERYASKKRGDALVVYAKTLVQPGTRAGEPRIDNAGKAQLFDESLQAGRAWFRDFSKWANARSPPAR